MFVNFFLKRMKLGFSRRLVFLLILINLISLSGDPALYNPQKIILSIENPAKKKSFTKKNLVLFGKRKEFVLIRGFFHELEVLEEATKNGERGFLVLKPFSFVRESNPSSGWPSWYALDAVLVNVGWVPLNGLNHKYKNLNYDEPLFREPITIYGRIRNSSSQKIYKKSGVILLKPRSIVELWEEIDNKRNVSDLPPYALNALPICLDLISNL
ncbi:hypothetical protein EHQ97_01125 [Leptospira adleri]|nr:hypothetical protein EHQ97_01125 [Leptospira adleri]